MRLAIILPFLLSACAAFPTLQDSISPRAAAAPYPVLTPLPAFPPATGTEDAVLQGRVNALKARAARLRQIDIGALQ